MKLRVLVLLSERSSVVILLGLMRMMPVHLMPLAERSLELAHRIVAVMVKTWLMVRLKVLDPKPLVEPVQILLLPELHLLGLPVHLEYPQ